MRVKIICTAPAGHVTVSCRTLGNEKGKRVSLPGTAYSRIYDRLMDWRDLAECSGMGTELFFPAARKGERDRIARAKEICGRCRVREQCLEYSIAHDCLGIWGGTMETERRRS